MDWTQIPEVRNEVIRLTQQRATVPVGSPAYRRIQEDIDDAKNRVNYRVLQIMPNIRDHGHAIRRNALQRRYKKPLNLSIEFAPPAGNFPGGIEYQQTSAKYPGMSSSEEPFRYSDPDSRTTMGPKTRAYLNGEGRFRPRYYF